MEEINSNFICLRCGNIFVYDNINELYKCSLCNEYIPLFKIQPPDNIITNHKSNFLCKICYYPLILFDNKIEYKEKHNKINEYCEAITMCSNPKCTKYKESVVSPIGALFFYNRNISITNKQNISINYHNNGDLKIACGYGGHKYNIIEDKNTFAIKFFMELLEEYKYEIKEDLNIYTTKKLPNNKLICDNCNTNFELFCDGGYSIIPSALLHCCCNIDPITWYYNFYYCPCCSGTLHWRRLLIDFGGNRGLEYSYANVYCENPECSGYTINPELDINFHPPIGYSGTSEYKFGKEDNVFFPLFTKLAKHHGLEITKNSIFTFHGRHTC